MAIQYSPKTLQQATDQVMLLASQHKTAINLDWQTAALFVNRAVREVVSKTLPYKDWSDISTVTVTNGGLLPANFIRPIRLLVSAGGEPPFREARFVDVEDFFSLSNWYRKQSLNAASTLFPIYTLWGPRDIAVNTPAAQSTLRIYIAPYTNSLFTNETGTAPAGYSYYTGTELSGQLDCYLLPTDLTNPASVLPVSYEYEGLVIMYALMRVYAKIENYAKLQEVQKQSTEEQMRLRKEFMEKRDKERETLEALLDAPQPMPVNQRGR